MGPVACRHWVPRDGLRDHSSFRWELCMFIHESTGSGKFLGVLATVQLENERWRAAAADMRSEHAELEEAKEWAERVLREQASRASMPTERDIKVGR